MTTHGAIAAARHEQALAALAAVEAELLAAMRAVQPTFSGMVDAMQDRRWEAKMEGPRPCWELALAYSAHRRAHRAEAKARSAAHRAQSPPAPAPASKPTPRPRKPKKVAPTNYVRERRAEEAALAS